MSVQEGVIRPPRLALNEQLLYLLVVVAALLFVGPLTLFGGALLYRWWKVPRTWRAYGVSIGAGLIGLLLFYLNYGAISSSYDGVYNTVLHIPTQGSIGTLVLSYAAICILTLPLVPSIAGGLVMFDRTRKALRTYKTTEEWKEEQLAYEEQAQAAQEHQARRVTEQHPTEVTPHEMYIGTYIGGESLPRGKQGIGLQQRGRWIVGAAGEEAYGQNIIPEHMFVVGATGAGKTQTLYRLCEEVLKNSPELDLVVVDGKGDEEVARKLRALIWKHRAYTAPVVSLDPPEAGQRPTTYHGFCGAADAIYNRLAVMVKTNEASSAGEVFYANHKRDILSLVCKAPSGPPRSFVELRRRLNLTWLKEAYRDDPDERADIETFLQAQLDEVSGQFRPLTRLLRNVVSERGFKLEETRAAIFSLDTLSNKDSASRFCEFFIEDFKNFVNRRAKRPGFLIIDEFGAFGNENIKDLLSMARSRGWGVALLTQDYANLGDDMQARQVVANCTTRFLMRTDFPEEMAMLAGTKLQVEGSIQRGPEGATGMGSDRLQHALKIDPNAVRRAPKGKAWLYRYGYMVEVQISPVRLSAEEEAAVPSEYTAQPEQEEQPPTVQDTPPAVQAGEDAQKSSTEGAHKKRNRGNFKLK